MAPPSPVTLLHVDDFCLVADKPAGLLSVPGLGEAGRDCLAARVQARFPDALVVHRLDMATSGVMLFARGAVAQRTLSIGFAQRTVDKRYVAVVAGRLEPDSGQIDLPLSADWPNRPRQKVDHAHGKPSLTHYRVLQHDPASNTTRVELAPLTGRAHQLRVHLMASGHPILGDLLYAPATVQARAARLLLHATALRFAHPSSAAPIEVASPAPF